MSTIKMSERKKSINQTRGRRRNALLLGGGLVLSTAGLALMLTGTTPDRVGPIGITVFFALVFMSLLALGGLLRAALVTDGGKGSHLFVILSAAAITVALAIGTIELQVGDIVLLALFVVTFSVYWSRLR